MDPVTRALFTPVALSQFAAESYCCVRNSGGFSKVGAHSKASQELPPPPGSNMCSSLVTHNKNTKLEHSLSSFIFCANLMTEDLATWMNQWWCGIASLYLSWCGWQQLTQLFSLAEVNAVMSFNLSSSPADTIKTYFLLIHSPTEPGEKKRTFYLAASFIS